MSLKENFCPYQISYYSVAENNGNEVEIQDFLNLLKNISFIQLLTEKSCYRKVAACLRNSASAELLLERNPSGDVP